MLKNEELRNFFSGQRSVQVGRTLGVLREQLHVELAAVVYWHLGPLANLGGEVNYRESTRCAKPRCM